LGQVTGQAKRACRNEEIAARTKLIREQKSIIVIEKFIQFKLNATLLNLEFCAPFVGSNYNSQGMTLCRVVETLMAVKRSRLDGLLLILAFLLLAASMYFMYFVPTLTDRQFGVLRIIMALAGAGFAATMPGFLDLRLKAGNELGLRATGALGVFIILYFFSPAQLSVKRSTDVNNVTLGNKSPIMQDNSGTVIIKWR
jgi:hypothetical protein